MDVAMMTLRMALTAMKATTRPKTIIWSLLRCQCFRKVKRNRCHQCGRRPSRDAMGCWGVTVVAVAAIAAWVSVMISSDGTKMTVQWAMLHYINRIEMEQTPKRMKRTTITKHCWVLATLIGMESRLNVPKMTVSLFKWMTMSMAIANMIQVLAIQQQPNVVISMMVNNRRPKPKHRHHCPAAAIQYQLFHWIRPMNSIWIVRNAPIQSLRPVFTVRMRVIIILQRMWIRCQTNQPSIQLANRSQPSKQISWMNWCQRSSKIVFDLYAQVKNRLVAPEDV